MTAPPTDSPRPSFATWILPLLGVVCVLGGFAWAIHRKFFDAASMTAGGVGIALFLTGFVRAEVANLRYYFLLGLHLFFVLGTCAIVYVLASRHNVKFDLTDARIHTISEATESYLQVLNREVEIVVFDSTREPYKILDRYQETTPYVKWTIHDPRKEPDVARQFDPAVSDGLIYIRHGDKTKRISKGEMTESSLTSAIVEVTREKPIKIYFLGGHGELSIEAPKPTGDKNVRTMSAFKKFLASRAMDVAPLNLLDLGYVPNDASMIVIAGPTSDLREVEARQLERYLRGGGKVLLLFDLPPINFSVDFTELGRLLRRRGLDDQENVLLDMRGARTKKSPLFVPLAKYNGEHPITKPMLQTGAVIYAPLVRVLGKVDPAPPNLKITPLVVSSPEAWAEPFVNVFVAKKDPEIHPPPKEYWQERAIGWAVWSDAGASPMRLAVYGSSTLVQDGYITNSDATARLMLNTVNWLVEQGDRVYVPEKIIAGTPLILSPSELQLILVLIAMAFPLAIIAGGVTYSTLVGRT